MMHHRSLPSNLEPMRAMPPQLPLSRSAHTNSQQPFGKSARLAGLIAPIAPAGATLGFAANPVQALTQLADAYPPANWTQTIASAGLINTSGALTSIDLAGSASFAVLAGDVCLVFGRQVMIHISAALPAPMAPCPRLGLVPPWAGASVWASGLPPAAA